MGGYGGPVAGWPSLHARGTEATARTLATAGAAVPPELGAPVFYLDLKRDDVLGVDPFADLGAQLESLLSALLRPGPSHLAFLSTVRSFTSLISFPRRPHRVPAANGH